MLDFFVSLNLTIFGSVFGAVLGWLLSHYPQTPTVRGVVHTVRIEHTKKPERAATEDAWVWLLAVAVGVIAAIWIYLPYVDIFHNYLEVSIAFLLFAFCGLHAADFQKHGNFGAPFVLIPVFLLLSGAWISSIASANIPSYLLDKRASASSAIEFALEVSNQLSFLGDHVLGVIFMTIVVLVAVALLLGESLKLFGFQNFLTRSCNLLNYAICAMVLGISYGLITGMLR